MNKQERDAKRRYEDEKRRLYKLMAHMRYEWGQGEDTIRYVNRVLKPLVAAQKVEWQKVVDDYDALVAAIKKEATP